MVWWYFNKVPYGMPTGSPKKNYHKKILMVVMLQKINTFEKSYNRYCNSSAKRAATKCMNVIY
jgi:hypothetical protein